MIALTLYPTGEQFSVKIDEIAAVKEQEDHTLVYISSVERGILEMYITVREKAREIGALIVNELLHAGEEIKVHG